MKIWGQIIYYRNAPRRIQHRMGSGEEDRKGEKYGYKFELSLSFSLVLWLTLEHKLHYKVCPTLRQCSWAMGLPHQSHERGRMEVKNSQVLTRSLSKEKSSEVSNVQALESHCELLAAKHAKAGDRSTVLLQWA